MTQHNYTIPDFLNKQRIDKALAELCDGTSRSHIQRAVRNKQVSLNGKVVETISIKVKENDEIIIILEEEAVNEGLLPNNIPIDVIYEDDDLIVINKSSSMTVHPGAGNTQETLVNALLYHSKALSDISGDIRPGIVHRLDKNTSGLMVVAKNNRAHVHLANQIETRELMRQYKALVWGVIKPVSGEINMPIGRSTQDRKRMSVLLKGGGKRAVTHYNTTEILHSGLFSLVECKLETGRTHQIRVHLSHSKHSIVGDQTYGNNLRKIQGCPDYLQSNLKQMKHQALHSFYISFIHPTSEERIEFTQEVPEDFNQLLNFIRQK